MAAGPRSHPEQAAGHLRNQQDTRPPTLATHSRAHWCPDEGQQVLLDPGRGGARHCHSVAHPLPLLVRLLLRPHARAGERLAHNPTATRRTTAQQSRGDTRGHHWGSDTRGHWPWWTLAARAQEGRGCADGEDAELVAAEQHGVQ